MDRLCRSARRRCGRKRARHGTTVRRRTKGERTCVRYGRNSACHYPLLSSGADEDTYLYLKYFADEDWRTDWLEQSPEYEMPAHEDPPYDRDRLLPQPTYGPPSDDLIQ